MTDWRELADKYFMNFGGRRLRVTLVLGEGAQVWDDTGRQYLDFIAGYAVNSLGHCHPAVADAVAKQAHNLIQVSNDAYSIPQVQLAQLLVQNSCLDKVFLCNSGAEANEGAVKLARRYGKLHLNGAYKVMTANNSFHGRTLMMVAATGQSKFHEPYTPIPDGFVYADYDSIEAIQAATTPETCAVMLEPIQGEGGVVIPSDDYFKEVRAWCDEKGLLLILDEVQTGIGRTGSLFGYQQLGIEPDVITLAKGLGSGVPIGAILAKENASVFVPGDHASTFGGNPLASAAGYATVKFILEHKVAENAQRVGQYLMAQLERLKPKFDFITEVRGRGLLVAVQFDRDMADEVMQACLDQGLLINSLKPNVIRFMPPLIITEKDVDEAMGILEKVLAEVKIQ